MRSRTVFVAVLLTSAAALVSVPAFAGTAGSSSDCAGMAGLRIPASAVGLPTTGGEVTDAAVVAASGVGSSAIGEYCKVTARIHPVDPDAPDIQMQVGLPVQWNEKSFMFGGGGYDGTVPAIDGDVPFAAKNVLRPLGRGYATFASDSGHQADPTFIPSTTLDGSFGVNDEALRNFAGDALKKTRDAATYIIDAHYGRPPALGYFAGGSSGGREALAVAQRWPRDFDGVISVYPAWNAASLDLFFGYATRVLAEPGAFPDTTKQQLVYDAVVGACDGLDGLRDKVISNEADCDYDPAALRCPGGADIGPTCLSDKQIAAVRALSSPIGFPYRLGSGERGYPGFPFLSGATMTTPLLGMGAQAPANPMPKASGYGMQFWEQWVRYFVTRDPSYNSLELDPLNPGPWTGRVSDLSELQDVNSTELRPFARRGGKLLILHGTADELVSHRSTAQYYERLTADLGERRVRDFTRFYLVPGANHVNLNAAFSAGWDSVTALEAWVEHGRSPQQSVVADTGATANRRTRPLCEYPQWPRYDGVGDVNAAGSFDCVD